MGGGTKRGYASEQLNQVGVAPSGPGSQVCTPSSATHATCDASVLCDVTFRIQLVGGCERSRSGGLRGGGAFCQLTAEAQVQRHHQQQQQEKQAHREQMGDEVAGRVAEQLLWSGVVARVIAKGCDGGESERQAKGIKDCWSRCSCSTRSRAKGRLKHSYVIENSVPFLSFGG